MRTALLTAHWDGLRLWLVCPSEVEQSRDSTDFDMNLKSPGSLGTSGLCPRVTGGETGLTMPLRIVHSQSESSRPEPFLLTVVYPVSYHPVPAITHCLFFPFSGFSWLLPASALMVPTVVRTSSGHTAGAAIVVTANR